MTELNALADRAEAAKGPDRELDARIWLTLNRPDWLRRKDWKKTNGWWRPEEPISAVSYYTADGTGGSSSAPAYTASVDAALSLVPEGWSFSLGELRGIGKFRGWLNDHNTPDGLAVRHVDSDAATPALALCAAALRAKEVSDHG